MSSINDTITITNRSDIIDEITIIKNSVALFEMKYGKFMDKNALDSLDLIFRSINNLEHKLIS